MKGKRNLVIVTPDQLRADYLGCYGHPSIGTQYIDKIADEGVLLENCYCAAPLCAPSRISFATSTYVGEHSHRNYWSEISPDVPNLVKELHDQGYYTGMFGKNHLFTYDRLSEVWDELDEICLGNYDGHPEYVHSFSSFCLDKDHEFNITSRLTEEGIDFIQRNDQKPFFLWLNYQDPHPAYICPEPYCSMFDPETVALPKTWGKYNEDDQPIRNKVWRAHAEMNLCGEKETRQMIAHYMGQIRYVDDCVGRLYKILENRELLNNTVILFFSDHGELLGDYGMNHKNPTFYDCLSKIPVIIRYPQEEFRGRRFTGLVEEVDLVPTLFDILNIEKPPTMVGNSIHKAILKNEMQNGKDTVLCEAGGGAPTCLSPIKGLKLLAPHAPSSFGPGAMLRKGSWKLSVYSDDLGELYNLDTDPAEIENLYEKEQWKDVREQLTLELLKRILSVKVRNVYPREWEYTKYLHDVRFEPLEF